MSTKYWVIRHDIVDTYLQETWDAPGRRWGKFAGAKPFGSKDAAVLVIDTMFPGCMAIEVSETAFDLAITSELPEWYRERVRESLQMQHQKQHHQGREHVAQQIVGGA